MMKPKAQTEHEEGMLEYLEDIIGSNRFKDPIELLTQRIEKIQEIRSEKVSIFFVHYNNMLLRTHDHVNKLRIIK